MVPKFRAWDKHVKKIRKVTEIHFDDSLIYLKANNGKGYYCSFSDIELMQSTGLKDKNGVEIYCGDIVSVRNHPFQKTEKSGAGIEIDGDYAISWNEGDLTWCAGNLLLARLKPYVTVAGNIYENPELLDQSNES